MIDSSPRPPSFLKFGPVTGIGKILDGVGRIKNKDFIQCYGKYHNNI